MNIFFWWDGIVSLYLANKENTSPFTRMRTLDLGSGNLVLWILKTHSQVMKVLSIYGMEMKTRSFLSLSYVTLPNSFRGFIITRQQVLVIAFPMLMACLNPSLKPFSLTTNKGFYYHLLFFQVGVPSLLHLCLSSLLHYIYNFVFIWLFEVLPHFDSTIIYF